MTTLSGRVIAVALAGLGFASSAFRQDRQVQVGYCVSLKDVAAAKAAGFDYLELGTSEINALSDADFERALDEVKRVGLPVPVTNLFLPAAIKVTGPETNPEQQMAYVKKAFPRLSRLGTEIVVFGSGGARRVPDGFSKDEAFKQLVEFGKRIAPEARAHGLTIAIEPLRRQETNIINSAAEGLELVKAIDHPNFQLMIDFYHLASEKEDPAIVLQANERIRHLHTANPQGRVFPIRWDEYDYAAFFANLRKIGYSKRISVEASTKDLASEGPQAIAMLRRAFTGVAPAPAVPAPASPSGAAPAPQAASVGPRPNVGPADRPLVDPVAADRGRRVWATECITCHGASARGTENGANLIRSLLVLRDRQGSELGPFLKKGHPTQSGTPSASLASAQVVDLMHFLRQRINDTLRGSPVFTVQDILTGDATAGAAYFNGEGKCTTCHSVTGDLAGVASRLPNPVDLQQRMLFPIGARGRGAARGAPGGGPAAPSRTAITVTLTPASGAPMSGVLIAEDDFFVTFRDTSDTVRVVRRTPGLKVVKTDPLQAHHESLDRITDKNIHDLVAYLVTLK